jgi:uncharacterized cupredoxin-like copper-binding protein
VGDVERGASRLTNVGIAQRTSIDDQALRRSVRRTGSRESFREDFADLKVTLLIVGAALLVAGVTIGVSLLFRSSGPAGDVAARTTEFRISMPKSLRAGHHTFAYTNNGSIPHELLVFRTDLAGNALPVKADGSVDEESPLLHKVADSGNQTSPGRSESVPATKTLAPGHYVAACNLPGHYQRGMWLDVTVAP